MPEIQVDFTMYFPTTFTYLGLFSTMSRACHDARYRYIEPLGVLALFSNEDYIIRDVSDIPKEEIIKMGNTFLDAQKKSSCVIYCSPKNSKPITMKYLPVDATKYYDKKLIKRICMLNQPALEKKVVPKKSLEDYIN